MSTANTGEGFTLWIQALDVPSAVTVAGEAKPVVEAMLTIRPEFDFLRHDHETAPMRRAWHFIGKAFLDLGNRICKCFA